MHSPYDITHVWHAKGMGACNCRACTISVTADDVGVGVQGNPCCEEPDYRLTVVHHMPSLEVLDQHKVTPQERHKAKALIGGDVQVQGKGRRFGTCLTSCVADIAGPCNDHRPSMFGYAPLVTFPGYLPTCRP
jgi:hypothetical protein